jgi:hypothetical protein
MKGPNKVQPVELPKHATTEKQTAAAVDKPAAEKQRAAEKAAAEKKPAERYVLELVQLGLTVQLDKKADLSRCVFILVMLFACYSVTASQLKQQDVYFATTAIKVALEEDAQWGGFDGDKNVESNTFADIDSVDHFFVWFRDALLGNVLYAYSPEIEAETADCVLSNQNLGYCMNFWQGDENRRKPSRDWATSMPYYNRQKGIYMNNRYQTAGRVGNYNFVMGGLKITQFRGAAGLCTKSVMGTVNNVKAQGYSSTFRREYDSTVKQLEGAGVFCYSEVQQDLNKISYHPQCASRPEGILSTEHCVASWSDLWNRYTLASFLRFSYHCTRTRSDLFLYSLLNPSSRFSSCRPIEKVLIEAAREYTGADLGSGPTRFYDHTNSLDASVNGLFDKTVVEHLAFVRYYWNAGKKIDGGCYTAHEENDLSEADGVDASGRNDTNLKFDQDFFSDYKFRKKCTSCMDPVLDNITTMPRIFAYQLLDHLEQQAAAGSITMNDFFREWQTCEWSISTLERNRRFALYKEAQCRTKQYLDWPKEFIPVEAYEMRDGQQWDVANSPTDEECAHYLANPTSAGVYASAPNTPVQLTTSIYMNASSTLFAQHQQTVLSLIAKVLHVPESSFTVDIESDDSETDEFYYYIGWKYTDIEKDGMKVTSVMSYPIDQFLGAEIMARNLQESSHSLIIDQQNDRRNQLLENIHRALELAGVVGLDKSTFNVTAVHVTSEAPETLKSSFFCPLVSEKGTFYHPLVGLQREKCYFAALYGIANHAKEFFTWGNLGKIEGTTRAVNYLDVQSTLEYNTKIVDILQAHGWIDHNTRAIRITIPIYNANVNVFVVAKFIIRFDLGGGIDTAIDYVTYVPTGYVTTEENVRLVVEVLFLAGTVLFALQEVYVMVHGTIRQSVHTVEKRDTSPISCLPLNVYEYVTDITNVFDWIMIILILMSGGQWINTYRLDQKFQR